MGKEVKVSTQGMFDLMAMLDKPTVQRIKDIVEAINPDMITRIMRAITVDKDGWITVKIKLGIQK